MGGAARKYAFVVAPEEETVSMSVSSGNGEESFSESALRANAFNMGRVLGKGKFGLVRIAQHKKSNKHYALKRITKESIYVSQCLDKIQSEILVLRLAAGHPFIASFLGMFETDECVFLVLEYCPGGELYSRMKSANRMCEDEAKFYFAELVVVLRDLQEQYHVVYRDLKPENILIAANGHIKLIDFGFARRITAHSAEHDGNNSPSALVDTCGTLMYVAPEICSSKHAPHSFPVDWWALGCVLYEMLVGKAPFGDSATMNKFEILTKIANNRVNYPGRLSKHVKTVLRGLLTSNPMLRWGWEQISSSEWMDHTDWDAVAQLRVIPPWKPDLKGPSDTRCFLDWSGEKLDPVDASPEAKAYVQLRDPGCSSPTRKSKHALNIVTTGLATSTELGITKKPLSGRRDSVGSNPKSARSSTGRLSMDSSPTHSSGRKTRARTLSTSGGKTPVKKQVSFSEDLVQELPSSR